MKLIKNNLKIFKSKYFIFLIIFTLGVGVLLYQVYVNTIQTSVIEGLANSETKISNIMTMFSSFFQWPHVNTHNKVCQILRRYFAG